MKVNINIECTPAEARAFFGLPDVSGLNEQLVEEMSRRMKDNLDALEPETLMRNWMTMGGEWSKHFMELMGEAGSSGGGESKK